MLTDIASYLCILDVFCYCYNFIAIQSVLVLIQPMYYNCIFHAEPKMSELLTIVVPKIAAHWTKLAYCLEFEVSRVEIIREQHPNDPEESCTKVFIHWLTSDEGVSPKTWGALIKVLKYIKKLTAVTEQIEKELIQR